MYCVYNANPTAARVGDCTVRAISKALGQTWDETYVGLCVVGMEFCDMPSANAVWGAYLKRKGFRRRALPDSCPECYTVSDFVRDHQGGPYVIALQSHVVAAENGNYYDTWDSGNETAIYYWERMS